MNKLLIVSLFTLLLGCSHPGRTPKQLKLKHYTQTVYFQRRSDSSYFPPYMILGYHDPYNSNDTSTYSSSVKWCYEYLKTVRVKYKTIGIKSSIIKNDSGINLEKTLSGKVRDSIDEHWKTFYKIDLQDSN